MCLMVMEVLEMQTPSVYPPRASAKKTKLSLQGFRNSRKTPNRGMKKVLGYNSVSDYLYL